MPKVRQAAHRSEPIPWRKSRRSHPADDCVEIAPISTDRLGMRDSKAPDHGILTLDSQRWQKFLLQVKRGKFDLRRM